MTATTNTSYTNDEYLTDDPVIKEWMNSCPTTYSIECQDYIADGRPVLLIRRQDESISEWEANFEPESTNDAYQALIKNTSTFDAAHFKRFLVDALCSHIDDEIKYYLEMEDFGNGEEPYKHELLLLSEQLKVQFPI